MRRGLSKESEAKLVLENIKILYSDAFSVDVLPMSHVPCGTVG